MFGLTGDLGMRMTIPALYRLHLREAPCDVVGIGRRTDHHEVDARSSIEE